MTSPEYQPYGSPEQPATPYIPGQAQPSPAEQFPTRVDPYNPPAQPGYGYGAPAPAAPASTGGYASPATTGGYAAPVSAPSGYTAPVSAPSGYQPVSAAPASAAPVTGFPVSSPSGYPVVYPPVAPAAKSGKGGFITVTIIAVVCLVATAVLTVLFLGKSSDYDKANKLAKDEAVTIAADQTTIASTKDQLTAANAASAKLQSDLDDEKNQVTEITHEKDVIAKCVIDLNKFFDAADRGASNATLQKLSAAATKSCREANKFTG